MDFNDPCLKQLVQLLSFVNSDSILHQLRYSLQSVNETAVKHQKHNYEHNIFNQTTKQSFIRTLQTVRLTSIVLNAQITKTI